MLPAQHRQQLTAFQKGQIEGRRHTMSHAGVGRELGIPRRTITSFLSRFDEHGTIENLPRPGAPRKTSAAGDRYIVRTAESETRLPLAELRVQINEDVSEQTIRRRLHEAGIQKWRAVNRPLLSKKHAAQRLEWAREHRTWTREDWAKVAWSDESAIQKDSDSHVQWVFRRQTKDEKYACKNIRGKSRDGTVFQMIWASFVGDKLGPIVFVDGKVNSDVYIDVLAKEFIPFIDALNADGTSDVVFQRDNASPHTARKTAQFLTDVGHEHHFSVMHSPPNSPDMNPIENLWAHLKTELHRRYPDTKYIRGSPATVRGVLKARLLDVWWTIGEEVLNSLIDSMPCRVKALIAAKGWYTRF